ncbi:uncharacterized protein LOC114874456 isoform X2 [Osmia bicornis bicornis]|uniref:uncharacterized protein LOC114874456 isoform X2 n=1 Tax=Osmia bicornis bicornis TaxID=1437191 RepID=UPI001EAF8958|nr:uncharacterized protein LOC114874456 isoform X2 [Osmia bicornis bicornis]
MGFKDLADGNVRRDHEIKRLFLNEPPRNVNNSTRSLFLYQSLVECELNIFTFSWHNHGTVAWKSRTRQHTKERKLASIFIPICNLQKQLEVFKAYVTQIQKGRDRMKSKRNKGWTSHVEDALVQKNDRRKKSICKWRNC